MQNDDRNCRATCARMPWLAAFLLALPATGPAATYPNACRNSITTQWDQVSFAINASASPSPVAPGGAVTLSGITQTMDVPGTIFVSGYKVGLLTVGANLVPVTVHTVIDATATGNGQQMTNVVDSVVSTVISDPDAVPGTGDETATDGTLSVAYADEIWTADLSDAPVAFREHTDAGVTGVSGGGVIVVAHVANGFFDVQFRCIPGTVWADTPTLIDPAPGFATTDTIFGDGLEG